jgi:hypothetical protein
MDVAEILRAVQLAATERSAVCRVYVGVYKSRQKWRASIVSASA